MISVHSLTLYALRVISVKFLLVVSLLYKTQWSWELRTWSHKMNLIDTSTNSLHYFYWKQIGTTNENLNFDIGFKGLKELHVVKRVWLTIKAFSLSDHFINFISLNGQFKYMYSISPLLVWYRCTVLLRHS